MIRRSRTLLGFALLVLATAPAYAQPEGSQDADEPESAAEGTGAPAEETATAPDETAPSAESPAPVETAELAPAAEPEAGPGIVLTGSFFTRYELRHHYDRIGRVGPRFGELDATFYRARVGLASTPIDVGDGRAIVISAAPQAAGFWGPSGGLADAAVGFHEAKLRIQGATNWLDLGRFEMAYGDHLVIGNVDWHEVGRSFDGARLHAGLDQGAWLDTFVTMIDEGAAAGGYTGFAEGDYYFAGAYAGLGPMIGQDLDLDGYLLLNIAPDTPGMNDFNAVEATIGSRVRKQIETIALRAEGGLQFGKRPTADVSVLAFQIDADATISAADNLKLIAGGQYATGDDPDTTDKDEGWNQLYPTAHKFLGFMDIIGGRTNIMSAFGKVRFQQSAKLGLAADLHFFLRPQTPPGVDSYTGIEADLWGLYQLGKGLGLRAQYATFVPNDTGPLGPNDKLIHYVEIQLRYDLK